MMIELVIGEGRGVGNGGKGGLWLLVGYCTFMVLPGKKH